MKVVIVRFIRSKKRHKGQGMVEYALIIGLIAIVLVAALKLIPEPIRDILEQVSVALEPSP